MEKMPYSARLKLIGENKTIAKTGSYTRADGAEIKLYCTGQSLAAETVLEQPEILPDITRKTAFRIADHTDHADTISAILHLRQQGVCGEIMALNFANAMFAGGGYRLGGDAQEESLCRCSLLYHAILPHSEYYNKHRFRPSPLYSDSMLISNAVPIIRDMNGTLLPEPTVCTFVTCAAVNRNYAKLLFISDKKINDVMENRINGIVCAMVKRKPDAIVLGAFGCGMFGNKRDIVLPLIEKAVNRWVPDEMKVVFAQP
ncbi:MAG TPA: TIGR02452 family protein [Ruminococcus sp.]|nr:TIGR02452 family protein [Ruminococcus sp.]